MKPLLLLALLASLLPAPARAALPTAAAESAGGGRVQPVPTSAAAMPGLQAGSLIQAGLGLTTPVSLPAAPIAAPQAAVSPAGATAAPSADAATPSTAATADRAKLAAFAARAAELTPAPSRPAASHDAADAHAALAAAGEVLSGVTADQISRMPLENLNGHGQKIMDRLLGIQDARTSESEVLGAASATLGSLSPVEAAAAARISAVPAPKSFDRRRLVWPAAVAFVWTAWATLMTTGHHWGLFAHNWFMSVTMAAGSFVAGASSEGSGAVSFPVMTLIFHIKPAIARDFSLMIQSVGMTTAALTILAMGIKIEKRAILVGALAGAAGMALGMLYVAPLFAPPFAKMFFTSLWAAFALALWRLNRDKSRLVVEAMTNFSWRDVAQLAAFGVLGGMVSSIVGTGLCMVMFMLLVLRYKISEKVATPTSIILMASNALFGFFFKSAALGGMSPQAWNYWWVCVPIVVVGAPLGARFIKSKSRHFVAGFLYTAIALQLLAALLVIPQTPLLLATAASTFIGGSLAFRSMAGKAPKIEKTSGA